MGVARAREEGGDAASRARAQELSRLAGKAQLVDVSQETGT